VTAYDEAAFEAAAQLVHTNYSEKPWDDRTSFAERIWARGTLRAALHKLGFLGEVEDAEQARIDAINDKNRAVDMMNGFRAISLGLSDTLQRVWEVAGGDAKVGYGVDAPAVVVRVREALEAASGPPKEIEVTDTMVNDLALAAFGPSVVYDRERLRTALANALQTR